MIILYNPIDGKPIGEGYNDWIFEGEKTEAHIPGEVKQYEDRKGEALFENFGFLQKVTAKEAEEIAKRPKEGKFKCQYCNFTTDTKIALIGHTKVHKEEIERSNQPAVDPTLVPVAGGTRIVGNSPIAAKTREETQNGIDRDGVEWYGEGVQETHSFDRVREDNRGHFGKQKLTEDVSR